MTRFLLVCLGGAVGAGARYLLAGWVQRAAGSEFPWGTLSVNLLGSFALGVLVHLALTTDLLSEEMRLALMPGVMGGFTTYSTFNQETVESLRRGAFGLAGVYVAVTLCGGLVAGFLGLATGRVVSGR